MNSLVMTRFMFKDSFRILRVSVVKFYSYFIEDFL